MAWLGEVFHTKEDAPILRHGDLICVQKPNGKKQLYVVHAGTTSVCVEYVKDVDSEDDTRTTIVGPVAA